MGNYMGVVPETTYGTDAIAAGGVPQFHIQTESHNPGLNDENQFLNMGELAPVKTRKGYAEPSVDVTTSADTKAFSTFMYYLLGNYKFTEDGYTSGATTKNVHEFWGGKKRNLPSSTIAWATDQVEAISWGNILSSLSFTADTEITKIDSTFVYKKDKQKDIDIDSYDVTLLDTIPFIGYDWELTFDTFGNGIASSLEVEIDNNINTDNLTVLGDRFYRRRPKSDNREITLTVTTLFDEDLFDMYIKAAYGEKVLTDGYYYPSQCKTLFDGVTLKAQTCEESNEYVLFKFPKCAIELDSPLEASESAPELSFKVTPMFNNTVTLKDGTTTKLTDIYCQVVNDQDAVVDQS